MFHASMDQPQSIIIYIEEQESLVHVGVANSSEREREIS